MASGMVMHSTNKVPMMSATLATLPPPNPTRTATLWLAPLLTAGLLYLSFFPVAAGWLGWFALVPWLCLVRLPGQPRRLYLATFLAALAYYLPVLQWARVADPRMHFTWLFLAFSCAAFLPASLAILRRLDKRTSLPLTITLPLVWITAEYIRWGIVGGFISILIGSYQHDFPGGFGWYFLGHTQHDFLEVIQIADLAGAYAVSLIVLLVNAILFETLYVRDWFRRVVIGPDAQPHLRRSTLLANGVAVAALLLAALGYGSFRMSQNATRPGPVVALIQSNSDQRLRDSAFSGGDEDREKARRVVAVHFRDLVRQAARQRPDLIVTPETSYPGHWVELAPGKPDQRSRRLARDLAEDVRIPVLLGMNSTVGDGPRREKAFNSAILLDSCGVWQGRYDKVHRVPFGEYIPLRHTFPFLARLAPYDYDYEVLAGEEFTRFTLPGETPTTFGVMICYEDTDPAMARPYAQARPVNFLLNISNDGWFDGTAEHDQHLALCRFRAIETRRAIGRSVNMGISAVVDANGRVLAPEPAAEGETIPVWRVPENASALPVARWGEFKKVAGVVVARMPIDSRSSLYAATGDAFAMSCGGALVVSLVVTRRKRKKESAREAS